ncbi:MAG: hypothetical protein PSU94_15080, partial [Lacunisphaera sp.]|nr:hypothetical protein [Lacunisphaera sp.]
FRESVAEERVRKGFAAAGAPPEAVAALVDRRLLRVEDRLDMRRVEITHDVLCSVIGASRGVRHEREALEASRRELAAQWEREAATQRALKRARAVALVSIVLLLLATGGGVFGWMSLRRAQAAEVQAAQSRELAERARSESEKLIAFLLEDFYEELSPTGRVEIVGNLADKAVAYYDALPPELVTTQTRLYRAMALIRKANAYGESGRGAEAAQLATEARALIEKLQADNGPSDELTTALGLAVFARVTPTLFVQEKASLEEAARILRPLVASGRAGRSAKLALADVLAFLPHLESGETALATSEESRKILADLGAVDLTDLTAASAYADSTDTQARVALRLGRLDEAERLARIVGEVSAKVLERRPGDLRAMIDRFYSANVLGTVAQERHDFAAAQSCYEQETEAARSYALFNPADTLAWRNWNSGSLDQASVLEDQGKVADALRQYRLVTEREHDPRNKTGVDVSLLGAWENIIRLEAQQGNLRAARAALVERIRAGAAFVKVRGINPELAEINRMGEKLLEVGVLAAEGNYAAIQTMTAGVAQQIADLKETNEGNRAFRQGLITRNRGWFIEASLRQGRTEQAVTAARDVLAHPPEFNRLTKSEHEAMLARFQARLGQGLRLDNQTAEAKAVLGKLVADYRAQQAAGATETYFRQDFARALYQLALAQSGDDAGRSQRQALLGEAAGVLDGLSFEARQLLPNKELIKWVTDAQREARAAGT